MPSGREVRHTNAPLQRAIREAVLYAMDLQEGAGSPTLTNLGSSPVWQMDNGGIDNVRGDLKIPADRVRNTPIDIKIVFTVSQGGGDGNVVFQLRSNVIGQGGDVSEAGAIGTLVVSAPALNLSKTTNAIRIASSDIDGKDQSADLQMLIERLGDHASDTFGGDVYLLKVIAEYTAYV